MKKKITGGVYLVINPKVGQEIINDRLVAALKGGIQVVQIWNNWDDSSDKLQLINTICTTCATYRVPVLVNEEWQLLEKITALDGVHFDSTPENLCFIKERIGRSCVFGITCSNDTRNLTWAIENKLDYISFCSMFPSASAGNCELVMPATVQQARALTDIPIFVAGGMTPENIRELQRSTQFDGVAVISGLLNDENSAQRTREYINALNNLH